MQNNCNSIMKVFNHTEIIVLRFFGYYKQIIFKAVHFIVEQSTIPNNYCSNNSWLSLNVVIANQKVISITTVVLIVIQLS